MTANTYVVSHGDNLSSIAREHGVSTNDLIRLNPSVGASPHTIYPGMTIVVGKRVSTDSAYIVVKGDNLSSIAMKHGMSTGELLILNPRLRQNPHEIHPGMAIQIRRANIQDPRISQMSFDGKALKVYSISNNQLIASYPAISGLPPHSRTVERLIEKGREDLDVKIDYTQPQYQDVKDAGPIPEGRYTLRLRPGMRYDKSHVHNDNLHVRTVRDEPSTAGWGEGGWLLTESLFGQLDIYLGGRHGFFLHHDGGNRGTSGCIGLEKAGDIKNLRHRLQRAQMKGQQTVLIEVKYK